jgi:hypothetical protein
MSLLPVLEPRSVCQTPFEQVSKHGTLDRAGLLTMLVSRVPGCDNRGDAQSALLGSAARKGYYTAELHNRGYHTEPMVMLG